MPIQEVHFTGALGDILAARLDLPEGAPRAFALFAHCFTCSKDLPAVKHISDALNAARIAVLRFDFTGLGHSSGEFANTNFSSNVEDLVAAADYLREHHQAPTIIIGHSLGGAAVLAASERIKELVAVATIAAPYDPAHVTHIFKDSLAEIGDEGVANVEIAGRQFTIKQQFVEDLQAQKSEKRIHGLKKALLILHSPTDSIVDIDNARLIYNAAKHPKSFISLDNADHLLSRKEDARYVATVLASWASRYIGGVEEEKAAPSAETTEPGVVVVTETEANMFAKEVRTGQHLLKADEPVSFGGSDTGPSPYDYLLVSLGACTSMTIRMYANHKGWPLEEVVVKLSHEKIHATDCEECKTREGKIDRIERTLSFTGNLSEEQRARLMEIADKCPVHRTLHSEIVITSQLEEALAA